MKKSFSAGAGVVALSVALTAWAAPAHAGDMDHSQHHAHGAASHSSGAGPIADPRPLVKYPEALRIQTLTNMRDHLLTMGEIQQALATLDFDSAGQLAESRLGMSSLASHGAHDVAQYMPPQMQAMGEAMHRTASQFAATAQEASVTGDLKSTLAALSRLNQTCVACHASYRLQ